MADVVGAHFGVVALSSAFQPRLAQWHRAACKQSRQQYCAAHAFALGIAALLVLTIVRVDLLNT
jgi:hypothetical protein